MELLTSAVVNRLTGVMMAALPSSLGSSPSHSLSPLSPQPAAFLILEDSGDPKKLVNVFDDKGNKVFSLERFSSYSQRWHMYAEPSHVSAGIIHIGLFTRTAQSVNDGNVNLLLNSGIRGKLHRHFYDGRGALYSWNRRSHYLERFSNPNGDHEEHRTVVGFAKQLRSSRGDWELLVDTQEVSVTMAIVSAFITIKTQWVIPEKVIPGTRTKLPSAPFNPNSNGPEVPEIKTAEFVNNDLQNLLVFDPPPISREPRDFFNPPVFMRASVING